MRDIYRSNRRQGRPRRGPILPTANNPDGITYSKAKQKTAIATPVPSSEVPDLIRNGLAPLSAPAVLFGLDPAVGEEPDPVVLLVVRTICSKEK